MKKAVMGAVLGAWSLVGSVVQAEPPKLTTNWYFRIDYESGQFSESTDPTAHGPVLMYTGSPWRCERKEVTLNTSGFLVGGFNCTHNSGSGWVSIIGSCHATKPDEDTARGGIGGGSSYIRVLVMCATKSTAPAGPAKATGTIERNL